MKKGDYIVMRNWFDSLRRTNETHLQLKKIPILEVYGQSRILIENHLGIIAYETGEIKVKVAFGIYLIKGSKLVVLEINCDHLVISGYIDGVEIIGGENGK